MQAPFVELVEYDGADALKKRVREELAGQDALRENAQPRRGTNTAVEANLIANLGPHRPATFLRDPRRGGPRGDSTRLEHHDRRPRGVQQTRIQQGRRYPCRLPRPRRSHQNRGARDAQSVDHARQQRVNGQRNHEPSCRLGARCYDCHDSSLSRAGRARRKKRIRALSRAVADAKIREIIFRRVGTGAETPPDGFPVRHPLVDRYVARFWAAFDRTLKCRTAARPARPHRLPPPADGSACPRGPRSRGSPRGMLGR